MGRFLLPEPPFWGIVNIKTGDAFMIQDTKSEDVICGVFENEAEAAAFIRENSIEDAAPKWFTELPVAKEPANKTKH